MDVPTVISSLSAPLEGETGPCGPDMVFSVEFDRLAELRREDDPTIDQGDWVTELKKADWPAALSLAQELLQKRTKDLRVAAWWAESAAHVHGFGGLAEGLSLYAALCREHWTQVHPLPDGDDQELRVGSMSWLLTQTRTLCQRLPVLRLDEVFLGLIDIEAARRRPAPTGEAVAAGANSSTVTMDTVQRAQRATPPAQMLALLGGAQRLPDALAELQAVIDERLGSDGPAFASTRDVVQSTVMQIERLARDMGALTSAQASATEGDPTPSGAGATDAAAGAFSRSGSPESRAQAIAQLRQVAAFFRRTEPHSPVAYLADRAAHWGEMPLHEWLRAVLKEQTTLAQLEELLGVEAPPAPPAS